MKGAISEYLNFEIISKDENSFAAQSSNVDYSCLSTTRAAPRRFRGFHGFSTPEAVDFPVSTVSGQLPNGPRKKSSKANRPNDDIASAESLCSELIKMNRKIVFNKQLSAPMQLLKQIDTTIGFPAASTSSHDT